VLDGGWGRWTAEGRPISREAPQASTAVFQGAPRGLTLDAAWVLAHLGDPQVTLLDARAPGRWRGEGETIDPVGGRIPGARNRFFKDNLQADGRFKPAEQLRAEFEPLLDGRPVVQQCGSGVTACHNLLAMEVAGLGSTALYPGSWSEWSSEPARPMARKA
jgi:thiosulfate/3-mercaptopyruvate sulfurtransferase